MILALKILAVWTLVAIPAAIVVGRFIKFGMRS
jgi:hypothetical protein